MQPVEALVIIDMQPHFPAAKNEAVIANVVREVSKARQSLMYIFVLG